VVPGCDHVRMFIWVRSYIAIRGDPAANPRPPDIPPLSAAQSVPPSTFYVFNPTPPFQRHVTRQKILNWKQSLKFPSKPRVSHEGINLMQQLLCEPEDRLGSQVTASVSRPNSLLVQSRRSGFIPPVGQTESVDGACMIKARCSIQTWKQLD